MNRQMINGKWENMPYGKVDREYLEKQSIRRLVLFVGLKSRSIKDCKNKLVEMLDGVTFS